MLHINSNLIPTNLTPMEYQDLIRYHLGIYISTIFDTVELVKTFEGKSDDCVDEITLALLCTVMEDNYGISA